MRCRATTASDAGDAAAREPSFADIRAWCWALTTGFEVAAKGRLRAELDSGARSTSSRRRGPKPEKTLRTPLALTRCCAALTLYAVSRIVRRGSRLAAGRRLAISAWLVTMTVLPMPDVRATTTLPAGVHERCSASELGRIRYSIRSEPGAPPAWQTCRGRAREHRWHDSIPPVGGLCLARQAGVVATFRSANVVITYTCGRGSDGAWRWSTTRSPLPTMTVLPTAMPPATAAPLPAPPWMNARTCGAEFGQVVRDPLPVPNGLPPTRIVLTAQTGDGTGVLLTVDLLAGERLSRTVKGMPGFGIFVVGRDRDDAGVTLFAAGCYARLATFDATPQLLPMALQLIDADANGAWVAPQSFPTLPTTGSRVSWDRQMRPGQLALPAQTHWVEGLGRVRDGFVAFANTRPPGHYLLTRSGPTPFDGRVIAVADGRVAIARGAEIVLREPDGRTRIAARLDDGVAKTYFPGPSGWLSDDGSRLVIEAVPADRPDSGGTWFTVAVGDGRVTRLSAPLLCPLGLTPDGLWMVAREPAGLVFVNVNTAESRHVLIDDEAHRSDATRRCT